MSRYGTYFIVSQKTVNDGFIIKEVLKAKYGFYFIIFFYLNYE